MKSKSRKDGRPISLIGKRMGSVLSAVVALLMMGSLIRPACAIGSTEQESGCTCKVHQHSDKCYAKVDGEKILICGYADYVVHVHNEDCYDEERVLICPLSEIPPHTHTDACFQEERVLNCGQKEYRGHVHTEDCYDEEENLICDKEEGEGGHFHSDDCYQVNRTLICGELELHTHKKSCYNEEGRLACGLLQLEQHQHTKRCLSREKEPEPEAEEPEELETTEEPETEEEAEESSSVEPDEELDASEETPAEEEAIESVPGEENQEDSSAPIEEPEADQSAPADPVDEEAVPAADGQWDSSAPVEELPGDTSAPVEEEQDTIPAKQVVFSMPPQTFRARTERVEVVVVAEEDTFPAETVMLVKDVSDEETLRAITDSIEDRVKQIQAVDITFQTAEGQDIEPLKPIRVTLTSDQIADTDQSVVVHMEDGGETALIEQPGEADSDPDPEPEPETKEDFSDELKPEEKILPDAPPIDAGIPEVEWNAEGEAIPVLEEKPTEGDVTETDMATVPEERKNVFFSGAS